MWCVVHVRDGEEKHTEDFVSNLLSESLNARCFHLKRSRKKKFEGQWQVVHENLFPGYVFIDTDQPEKVYKELKRTPKPKLLFSDDMYISTLEQHESDLMGSLADKNGIIGISGVQIAGDGTIRYLSGPLVTVKDRIRKVNLHKRIAELETSFLGRRQILYLGIEFEGIRTWH